MAASRSGLGIVRERAVVHCAPFTCSPHNSYHGGLQGRPVRSSTYLRVSPSGIGFGGWITSGDQPV